MIAVIDYGMGNLRSVYNAFQALGESVQIVEHPAALKHAAAIVLPGVGAFGEGARQLRERGFTEALAEQVRGEGKPFLGICLGLQLLATVGYEHGEHVGLGWVPGTVDKLAVAGDGHHRLRLPHIGWNTVRVVKRDGLYAGLGEAQDFYFVHSYALRPEQSAVVSGYCAYGGEFVASIECGNIHATQFHPEKSHRAGLRVLKNFAALQRVAA